MEFLRFGSSIPGEYWGCCAGDIIQNFKQDPDTPASIQLVSGDGGGGLTKDNELVFLGPTLRDIFWQRLRVSTFGLSDMPNHFFLAVLEQSQIQGDIGKKWLAILKEAGFEFLRAVDNSVYTGSETSEECSPHLNYIFGLFRNIGNGKINNPFQPPKAWTDLPEVIPEPWSFISEGNDIATKQRNIHLKIWKEHGPTKIMKESEIVAAGAPVIMAGLRTEFPPEFKKVRENKMAKRKNNTLDYHSAAGTQHIYASKSLKPITPLITPPITPKA